MTIESLLKEIEARAEGNQGPEIHVKIIGDDAEEFLNYLDGLRTDIPRLVRMLRLVTARLERLTKVGPPSRPTTGLEYAQVALSDNCKIAEETLAELLAIAKGERE